jgi:hypothetical protein
LGNEKRERGQKRRQRRGAEEPHLLHHKLALALVGDLEERVARHVLHARVRLVHELEELVDHGLQELPVGAQELGVLADDIPLGVMIGGDGWGG